MNRSYFVTKLVVSAVRQRRELLKYGRALPAIGLVSYRLSLTFIDSEKNSASGTLVSSPPIHAQIDYQELTREVDGS